MIKLVTLILLISINYSSHISDNTENEWYPMPDGKFYHIDCIHQYDDEFQISQNQNITQVSFTDKVINHEPCPHQPRGLQYYSDWQAYVQYVHPKGYSQMYTEMNVPSEPKTLGPTGLGAIYFFNGLENGHGIPGDSDYILQPVLQYGRSGCLLNPFKWHKWYLTSYVVNSGGRAYCGKNLGPLEQGEMVAMNMTLVNQTTSEWLIESTRLKTKEVSSHSALIPNKTFDAAYLTLEGMVIYGCNQLPESGSVEFSKNLLKDLDGNVVKPNWDTKYTHQECGQTVELGEPVRVKWDNSIKNTEGFLE